MIVCDGFRRSTHRPLDPTPCHAPAFPNGLADLPWKDLEFVEFFAGRARATLCMKGAKLRSARLDYLYHDGVGNNHYDILSDGGFAWLVLI